MAPPSSSWRSTRSARPTPSERKVEICERAYKLLTGIGFRPEDIIFDPNIFAIATGIDEHRRYAIDFIEAAREIRRRCPHVHISGGLSNLSFSFRGNEPVRRAMHSVFLYHAIPAGHGHGHRQRRPARRLRRDRPRAARGLRGRHPRPARRCDRAADRRSPRRYRGTDAAAEKAAGRMARLAGRRAARPRAGQGHRRPYRRRYRGSAAAVRRGRSRSSKAR